MSSKQFEVGVFNQQVRDLLKVGEQHPDFDEEWADTHYIKVNAPDEATARNIIARRYVPEKGFRIFDVYELDRE